MMTELDVWGIRARFPIFHAKRHHDHPFVYLDTAATAQKPKEVIDAMMQFYEEEYATVHRAVYELSAKSTEKYHHVRAQVKAFINAKSEEEIIFTRGTTQGLNIIARCFSQAFLEEGDEILITELEHHSNIVPWQMVALQKKLQLKIIPVNKFGELDLVAFRSLLTPKTKLISLAYITNTTGTIYPLEEVIKLAHHVGAKVVVDAAQAAGHHVIDVQKLGADFLVFSGHKLYGPTGIGILYGKKELLENMPPYEFGGDMIETVTFENTTFQKPPLRFEAGTPSIAEVIGLGAAIQFIQEIGLKNIIAWEQKLLQRALDGLSRVKGFQLFGPMTSKGPMITFTIQNVHSLDLGTILSLKGFALRTGQLCAQPALDRFGLTGAARISFGMYNTLEEVDHFVAALEEAILLLKPGMSSY